MENEKIYAVVVTYGNRWDSLACVLDFLQKDNFITGVIVVDNHSCYDVEYQCNINNFTKVILLKNTENQGSAAGFSQGMHAACACGAEYILLLDDDNVPREGAVEGLRAIYKKYLIRFLRQNWRLRHTVIANMERFVYLFESLLHKMKIF